jgi:voltage-gated potassium channel
VARGRLYDVIFESDTPAGRAFDLGLMLIILGSLVVVMLDSVPSLASRYRSLFSALEWGLTALFTVEYVLRLSCVRRPFRYALSFFGIVDLLSVAPTYIAAFKKHREAVRIAENTSILSDREYCAEEKQSRQRRRDDA